MVNALESCKLTDISMISKVCLHQTGYKIAYDSHPSGEKKGFLLLGLSCTRSKKLLVSPRKLDLLATFHGWRH